MQPMAIYSPWHLNSNDPPNIESRGYRFLAEGDSWFSIGALNPAKNSNLLFEMAFEKSSCAINCASPGDTLRRMSQMNTDRDFIRLLAGVESRAWDGVLLSAGGNDLIDALQVRGPGIPLHLRLLRTPDEWGDPSEGAARYLSDAGWATFCGYLEANLEHLVRLRDSGKAVGCPVFMHGYAVPTPRPAGVIGNIGPWLYPAVMAATIPIGDLIPTAALLIGRLGALLGTCAADPVRFPNLHFFDTSTIAVAPAQLGSTGEDGDWINEIHLTWRGYEKLALPWSRAIEAVLDAR